MSEENLAKKLVHPWGLQPDFENIPEEVRGGLWCVWRAIPKKSNPSKIDKVPFHAKVIKPVDFEEVNRPKGLSTSEPKEWGTFEEAKKAYLESVCQNGERCFDGVGIKVEDNFIGDLDRCVTDGVIANEDARYIYDSISSYTEYSPSSNGLRIFAKGKLPGKNFTNNKLGVEFYGDGKSNRFATVTGHIFPNSSSEVKKLSDDVLRTLYNKYKTSSTGSSSSAPMPEILPEDQIPKLSDVKLNSTHKEWLEHGFPPQGTECDRSKVLYAITSQLYEQDYSDSEVLSFMDYYEAKEVAREHWINNPLRYLWKTCCATRDKKPSTGFDTAEVVDLFPKNTRQAEPGDVSGAGQGAHSGDSYKPEIPDSLEGFLDRYVYIRRGCLVHDLDMKEAQESVDTLEEFTRQTSSAKEFVPTPTKYDPSKVKPVHLSKLWLEDSSRQNAHAVGFHPHEGRIFTSKLNGLRYINTFKAPEFFEKDAVKGSVVAYLNHMEYLLPIKTERKWFIDWMAFCVQRPQQRSKVHPLHISVGHGTGRGWVVELLRKLLGDHNCSTTQMSELCRKGSNGAFNEYLDGTLLCTIEEVKETDKRFEVSAKIRSVLDGLKYNVNLKSGKKEDKPLFTNFFFMSNHVDALVIPEDDRRIQVLSGPRRPKEGAYYDKLYGWSENINNVAALYFWLKKRDISAFNWKTSTDTEGRERMCGATRTPTEIAFREFLRETGETAAFFRDIVDQVQGFMEGDAFENPADPKQLDRLLTNFCSSGPKKIKYKGESLRPWYLNEWQPKNTKDVTKMNGEIRNEVQRWEINSDSENN